jgi:predicted nucleic acid binding AN1-type Zn finger protein
VFCGLHRAPEDHRCDFNFKKAHAAKLNQDNQRIVEDKLATRI